MTWRHIYIYIYILIMTETAFLFLVKLESLNLANTNTTFPNDYNVLHLYSALIKRLFLSKSINHSIESIFYLSPLHNPVAVDLCKFVELFQGVLIYPLQTFAATGIELLCMYRIPLRRVSIFLLNQTFQFSSTITYFPSSYLVNCSIS